MRPITIWIASLLLAGNGLATELIHFDREAIVQRKIRSISIEISRYQKEKEPEGWPGSCVVHVYEFDRAGNIVISGLRRLGTEYGYQYGDDGKLIGWSWKDRATGEVTCFTRESYPEPDEFEDALAGMQQRMTEPLENKRDFRKPFRMDIVEECANIDATYNVVLLEANDGLPAVFKAVRDAELGRFLEKDRRGSPGTLFIRYEYSFHPRPSTNGDGSPNGRWNVE